MTPVSDAQSRFVYDVGVIGNGPRGAALAINAVVVALCEAERFEAIQTHGTPFRIRFHVYEQKSWHDRAVGNAFSPRCHAVINTPVVGPSDICIPNLDKVDKRHAKIIRHATDLRGCLATHVESNWADILTEYERVNAAAAACLRYATRRDGTVDASLPYVTRGTMGKMLQQQLDAVMKEGAKAVPFLAFHFQHETEVVACNISSDRQRPWIITRDIKSNRVTKHIFDHLILAGGTASEVPVKDELLGRTYLGEANFDDIQRFFGRLGLLLPDGRLNPDTKVLVLGMGLSAMDKSTIGSASFVRRSGSDPCGFEFDDAYVGCFTNLSRNPGRYVAPRQTFSHHWLGPTHQPLSQLIIRAAFMDDSPKTLSNLLYILYAAAARALGTTPDRNPLLLRTPLEWQLETYKENLHYLGGTTPEARSHTWSGYLRAGMLAIMHGGGFEGS
ncbi:hypothetical protein CDD83_6606 [Cordyceps sp. RAO-2017]|nr:hypothetical protein CDD83_6606 [Cordyceps sp. RAO-2017]